MAIVVGYRNDPEGRAALERGIAEARLRSQPVHVVHVLPDRPADTSARLQQWGQHLEHARADARRIEQRLTEAGLEGGVEVVPVDSPDRAREILDAAERHDAQLLVIGIRTRTPVGKFVLGSIAQDILLGSDGPVLAVRA